MKSIIILILHIVTFNILFGQGDASKRISELIKFMDKSPKKRQIEMIKPSLESLDTLEYSLAISILFKHSPTKYKAQMMDAFEIPYEDSRRTTVKYFYKETEVSEINKKINKEFDQKYQLEKKDIAKIYMLYQFLEYRKRNVWTYKTEHFAIPTTIAIRGGYLRGLLNESMDYKQFIAEMKERAKSKFEKTNEGG